MQSPACHVVLCTWISRSIFNASLRAPGKTFHAQHEVVGRQTLTSYVAAVPSRWCRTPMSGPITAGPHPFSLCRAFVAAILGRRTTCTFQSCCGTVRIYALLSILFAGPRNSIGRSMPSALDGCVTPLDDLLALLCTQALEKFRKSCAPVFECPVTRCEGVCAYRTASRVMDGRPYTRSTPLSWRSR